MLEKILKHAYITNKIGKKIKLLNISLLKDYIILKCL